MADVSGEPRKDQNGARFSRWAFPGRNIPATIATIARSFAAVRRFWTRAPQRTPTAFAAVRTAMIPTARALYSRLFTAMGRPMAFPRNSTETHARAAMLAALMIVSWVQP